MRLAQDILENYIGVEEEEEDAAGEYYFTAASVFVFFLSRVMLLQDRQSSTFPPTLGRHPATISTAAMQACRRFPQPRATGVSLYESVCCFLSCGGRDTRYAGRCPRLLCCLG